MDPLLSLSVLADADGVHAYIGIPIVEGVESALVTDGDTVYAPLDTATLMQLIGALIRLHSFMEQLETIPPDERETAIETFKIINSANLN